MAASGGLPRRRVSDLVTQAMVEPKHLFVVVEGPFDKSVVSGTMRAVGNVFVYDATEIEVAGDPITGGNRTVVINTIIASRSIGPTENLVGIIDRDFDDLLDNLMCIEGLYYTDYSCMEAYHINQETIARYIGAVYDAYDQDDVVRNLLKWLSEFFVILAVRQDVAASASLPNFERFFSRENGSFDWAGYLEALPASLKRDADAAELVRLWREKKSKISGDVRFFVHEESFRTGLYLTMKALRRARSQSRSEFDAVIKAFLKLSDYSGFPLFRNIGLIAEGLK